jgi:hypothetical protein
VVDEFEGMNATKDEVDTPATSASLKRKAILVGGSLFGFHFCVPRWFLVDVLKHLVKRAANHCLRNLRFTLHLATTV